MKKFLSLLIVVSLLLTGQLAWAESKPDLSTSTVTDNTGDQTVSPGQTVAYTITLRNSGGLKATDFDFYMPLDPGFSQPENFTFKGCGKKVRNESLDEVDISNLRIKKLTSREKNKELKEIKKRNKKKKKHEKKEKFKRRECVITFDVIVNPAYRGGEVLNSAYYLSGSAEGGQEIGPVPVLELEVR